MALQAVVFPVPEDRSSTWLDGAWAPRAEVRGLFALVRTDAASVESIRELIGLWPRIDFLLRFYLCTHPEDGAGIEKVLRFRERVLEEFDRLVDEKDSANVPGQNCTEDLLRPVDKKIGEPD